MSKTLVYQYNYGTGGVADMIKYLFHTVDISRKTGADLKIYLNHPISQYLMINPKYQITSQDLLSLPDYYHLSKEDSNRNFEAILEQHSHLVIRPIDYYMLNITFDLSNELDFKTCGPHHFELSDYLSFTEEIYHSLKEHQPRPYIAIHYRLGDHYLETIPKIWYLGSDNRRKPDDQILDTISTILKRSNPSLSVYFLADNNQYKQIIREHFPSLFVFDNQIRNPSYVYNETKEVYMEGLKSAIVEFLFLSQSQEIHALSYSGFTTMSAYIGHKPLVKW